MNLTSSGKIRRFRVSPAAHGRLTEARSEYKRSSTGMFGVTISLASFEKTDPVGKERARMGRSRRCHVDLNFRTKTKGRPGRRPLLPKKSGTPG